MGGVDWRTGSSRSRRGRVWTLILLAGFTLAALAAPAGLSGCRTAPGGGRSGNPRDLAGVQARGAAVAVAVEPLPVVSDALGLVAFVSADGRAIYVWEPADAAGSGTGNAAETTVGARAIYTIDSGWSVKTMALSPAAGRPYLALTEAFDQGTGQATRVTVIATTTGDYRRVLPNPEFSPTVTTLQWSADGRRLFADGRPPLVVDITGGGSDIVWDLGAMTPDAKSEDAKSEARCPLLSPDFRQVAFTRFYLSETEGEDLWVLGEDEGSADRMTTGNVGAYPLTWLGGATDGSQPGGPYDFLLVMTGALSTGGGLPHGPAVVDLKTKTLTEWYPLALPGGGERTHRVALVDLPGRRVLVNSFDAMTGERGTTVWRSLADGAETELGDLAGLQVGGAASGAGGSVAAVVLTRSANGGDAQVWALDEGGSCRRLADIPNQDGACLVGRAGRLFILLAAPGQASGTAGGGAVFQVTGGAEPGLEAVSVVEAG